jgi:dTDP-4-amino-4,6-dideoxygalactose transaminase
MTVSLVPTTRAAFLPFSVPSLGEDEIQEVVDTLRSGWISTGPKVKRFEAEFAAYVGAPGAAAVNSCTAALHTALMALGIGSGAEVITTAVTFAASANVIEHVGARPVLVDVEPDTLNMDPAQLKAAITPRTRAVMPVHFAGHPADIRAIRGIARDHGLHVIEDAAHALPAKFDGRCIGAAGDVVAFSFYATKNLTTAEGGMLVGDEAFLDQARLVSLHGMSREAWRRYEKGGSWFYEILMPGFKYNMSDIQAALGLWQLRRLASMQQRRLEIVAMYNEAFADECALELPAERSDVEHAWHLYVLRLRTGTLSLGRDQFIQELARRNIGASVHFIPIHLHPYYRDKYGYVPESFPIALDNYQRMLSLPLHASLSDDDVADVVQAVLDIVRTHRQ